MSLDTFINAAIFAVALFMMVRFGCGRHMMGPAQSPAHAGAHGGAGGHKPAGNGLVDPGLR